MAILTIHSVNPTGMFSYGRSENIPLMNKGLIHLIGINEDKGGDSNGSGKSSLFNAMCELLFQENPTGEKGDAVCNSVWGRGMAGRIMFTASDGIHYRITYCRNWKDPFYESDTDTQVAYLGTNLFLDKYDPVNRSWKDFRGSGMPETKKKIAEIIGIDYSRFLAVSYMSHRAGSQFLKGTNKDRMDLLSGITGIGEWDDILEKCRANKKALNSQIESVNNKISYERGSVQTLREQLQNIKAINYEGRIQVLEQELAKKREDYAEVDKVLKAKKAELDSTLAEQAKSLDSGKIEQLKAQDASLRSALSLIERDLSITKPIQLDKDLEDNCNRLYSGLNQLKGRLAGVQGDNNILLNIDTCPTCSSPITEDQKNSIKAAKSTDIKKLTDEIESVTKAYQRACEELEQDKAKKVAEQETEKAKKAIQAQELRSKIENNYAVIMAEYQSYNSFVPVINDIQAEISKINSQLMNIRSEGEMKKMEISAAHSKLEDAANMENHIHEKEKTIKFYGDQIASVSNDLSVVLWLIDHIPAIKLHKMSIAMKEISNLVNSYFVDMGESLRVNISAFEEKVRAKNVEDTKGLLKAEVNVQITDGSKNISPKLYSDGELSKVSLAIAKALHEMARTSGQGCNVMILDEIFSFVDQNNSQRMASTLSSIMNRGTVFLTDNSDKVRDLVDFNHVWIARKRDGQTILEM